MRPSCTYGSRCAEIFKAADFQQPCLKLRQPAPQHFSAKDERAKCVDATAATGGPGQPRAVDMNRRGTGELAEVRVSFCLLIRNEYL